MDIENVKCPFDSEILEFFDSQLPALPDPAGGCEMQKRRLSGPCRKNNASECMPDRAWQSASRRNRESAYHLPARWM